MLLEFAIIPTIVAYRDFPGGKMVRNPPANSGDARDESSIAEYSLERPLMKLKLKYFGHMM